MSADELLKAIETAGGVLEVTGSGGHRLHYRLPANAEPLLQELRQKKSEIVPILRTRSFFHLIPYLGKRVWTPSGSGRLLRVKDYAVVELENAVKSRWYDSAAVIPYA